MPKLTKSKKQKAKNSTGVSARKLGQPKYKSFRLNKRIKQPKEPLKSSFRLFWIAVKTLVKYWRLFGGILLINLALVFVLVRGLGLTTGLNELKQAVNESFDYQDQFSSGLVLFGVLLGQTGAETESGNFYNSLLVILLSLAVIWALRQALAGKQAKIRVRDAFYKGMYPLIPFILILLVITLQLVPLFLGTFLYSVIIGGGLAVTVIEHVLWLILIGLLGLLSLYMVSSSVFALYIITLPEMTPMQALRSARDLVSFRRWMVLRKIILLPIIMFCLAAVVLVPLIIVWADLAEVVFLAMTGLGIMVMHSYLYNLYRELL